MSWWCMRPYFSENVNVFIRGEWLKIIKTEDVASTEDYSRFKDLMDKVLYVYVPSSKLNFCKKLNKVTCQ